MLKIRDDVNLEELEKFGFYKTGGVYQKNLEYDDIYSQIAEIDMCIYVVISDRIIRFSSVEKKETVKLDVLYDLIKEGLVIKR